MRDISEILADGGVMLERLLREAFDAGVAQGRRETAHDLRARFSGLFDDLATPHSHEYDRELPGAPVTVTTETTRRAAPGTVKPTIIRLIQESGSFGISTEDLIERTGFKNNSVRGTLSTLQLDGMISKLADKWHLTGNLLLQGAETNKAATDE